MIRISDLFRLFINVKARRIRALRLFGLQDESGAQGTARPAATGSRSPCTIFESWRLFTILLCLQLLAAPALAADKLSVDLLPGVLKARNNAPIPVEARFKWTGMRILEGRLELELHDGGQVLGRYRSDDLALTTGEQSFHLLLPPSLDPFDSQVEVRMRFVTADGALDLDPSSLFLATSAERSMTLGWCNARLDTQPHALDLEQSLFFEHFLPQEGDATHRPFLTSMVRLTPEDLPLQPLAYTPFDVLVLTTEGFAEARESQLQSLARWVRGGGSVCLFVGGGLQPHHLAFLNDLAGTDAANPMFLSGNDGNLLPGAKEISCLRSGLGRTVVVTGNLEKDPGLDSAEWREAAGFLWKFREKEIQAMEETDHSETSTSDSTNQPQTSIDEYAAQAQSFRRGGRFNYTVAGGRAMTLQSIDQAVTLTDAQKPRVKAALNELTNTLMNVGSASDLPARQRKMQAAMRAYIAEMKEILTPDQYAKWQVARRPRRVPGFYTSNPIGLPYSAQSSPLGSELMTELIPKTVRLIPFPALLGTLGLFLLMIGPADYYVLGWFRRRRYTWVLFPAVSLLFTLATVLMANHYLGARDVRRSLIVVDLDKDGTALRWNRYELVFAARDKEAVTELTNALWAPVNSAMMPQAFQPMPSGVRLYGRSSSGSNFHYSVGIHPPGYTSSGWTSYSPVSGGAERELGLPWYEGVLPAHFQTSESIRQWQPELNRVFSLEPPPVPLFPNWPAIEQAWPNLQNIRAKLSAGKPFLGDVCAISISDPATFGPGANTEPLDAVIAPRDQVIAGPDSPGILPRSILLELSSADSTGPLALVSQISPTGGGNFEDAPAMDASDSALAIVTRSGDDIVVYRRFFYGN